MDTRQVIARFEAERQALAMMDHPNIARVLEAGATEAGRPYFIMEYVDGIPITKFCDEHRLTTAARLELFMTVCDAVQHAHQKGIIHRDLKPSNVLVGRAGEHDPRLVPKVIDFGIAKATGVDVGDHTALTEHRQFIGTPQSMSPEQAGLSGTAELWRAGATGPAGALDVDTRSDIYSLGVLLYELLAGTTPFDGERLRRASLGELQRIIREEEPPRPSTRLLAATGVDIARARHSEPATLTRTLRGDLDWIVMKCLEKDRSRRYSTAAELAADIQRHLRHEPVTAGPPSRTYRMRKFTRRNRTVMAAFAAVGASLVLGLTATGAALVRAKRSHQSEVRQREAAEAAQRLAERSRDHAVAIRTFLTEDLLKAVDPYRTQGEELTVREALTRAALAVEGKFPTDPLIEAKIRSAIGMAYLELGDNASAELQFSRALELAPAELGNDHPDHISALFDLAQCYEAQGRYGEAEPMLIRVIDALRRLNGTDDHEVAGARRVLGLLYRNQGRIRQAEGVLAEVLRIRERIGGNDSLFTAESKRDLGITLQFLDRLEEAEVLLVDALETVQRLNGESHSTAMTIMTDLATVYDLRGRGEEAIQMYIRSLEVTARVYGEEHRHTLAARFNLGFTYLEHGNTVLAEPILRQTAEGARRTLGVAHVETIQMIFIHGDACLRLDDARRGTLYHEGVAIMEEALGHYRSFIQLEHPYLIYMLERLSIVYADELRFADAEAAMREAMEVCSRHVDGDHWRIKWGMYRLAQALKGQNKWAETESILLMLLEGDPEMSGRAQLLAHNAMGLLGEVYIGTSRLQDAETILRELVRLRTAAEGPEHRSTLAAVRLLADVYAARNEPHRAEPMYRQVVEAVRRTRGDDHPDTVLAIDRHSEACFAARHPEACSVTEQAVQGFRRVPAPRGRRYADALARLSDCCTLENRFVDAETAAREGLASLLGIVDADDAARNAMNVRIGVALLGQGRGAEAEALLQECLDVGQRLLSPDHLQITMMRGHLGRALALQERFDAAESLLLECYRGLSAGRDREPQPWPPSWAAEHLASLYGAWGKPQAAEEWRRKASE
jgi:eukaryotic-like serine/threonine-protein kinase